MKKIAEFFSFVKYDPSEPVLYIILYTVFAILFVVVVALIAQHIHYKRKSKILEEIAAKKEKLVAGLTEKIDLAYKALNNVEDNEGSTISQREDAFSIFVTAMIAIANEAKDKRLYEEEGRILSAVQAHKNMHNLTIAMWRKIKEEENKK